MVLYRTVSNKTNEKSFCKKKINIHQIEYLEESIDIQLKLSEILFVLKRATNKVKIVSCDRFFKNIKHLSIYAHFILS